MIDIHQQLCYSVYRIRPHHYRIVHVILFGKHSMCHTNTRQAITARNATLTTVYMLVEVNFDARLGYLAP